MKYFVVSNFLKGLVEHEGIEKKISNETLTKLHNVDLDITGRAFQRSGYQKWGDIPDSLRQGDKLNSEGNIIAPQFQHPIQEVWEYVDAGNKKYIVIIANGFIYFEDSENPQDWYCVNVREQLSRNHRICIAYYLDKLFFNEHGKDIWVYNANYQDGSKVTAYEEITDIICFYDNKIYLLSNYYYVPTRYVEISASGINGGSEIYQSLIDENYLYRDDLKLGFFMRMNNKYYVLDNNKKNNIQAGNKDLFLLKFSEAMILEGWVRIESEVNNIIYNFDTDDNYFYIHAKDETVIRVDPLTMNTKEIQVKGVIAPVGEDGKKHYSIAINKNGFVYFYSNQVPDYVQDWYQPVIIEKLYKIGCTISSANQIPHDISKKRWTTSGDNKDWNWDIGLPLQGKHCRMGSDNIGKNIYKSYNNVLKIKWLLLRVWPGAVNSKYFARAIEGMTGHTDKEFDPFMFIERWENPMVTGGIEGVDTVRMHWDWGQKVDQYTKVAPGVANGLSHNAIIDFFEYRLTLHKELHYGTNGKSNYIPQQIFNEVLGNDTREYIQRKNENCFYLLDKNTHNQIFGRDDSYYKSNHVLLLEYQIAGDKINYFGGQKISTLEGRDVNHRFLLPLIELGALKRTLPLVYHDNQIHFGTESKTNYIKYFAVKKNENNSYSYSNDIDYKAKLKENSLLHTVSHIDTVFGEYKQLYVDGSYKMPALTLLSNGYSTMGDYIHWISGVSGQEIYNSNLMRIGKPKAVSFDIQPDTNNNFDIGQTFRYYVSYQFYSGTNTPLSNPSVAYTITNERCKILLKDLNLIAYDGTTKYQKKDIMYINVFREDLSNNRGIQFLTRLEKNNEDDWQVKNTELIGQYIDRSKTLSSNTPIYDSFHSIQYRFNWIFVHKNRLCCVNNVLEPNQNTVWYSDIDNAEALPPTNFRAIQPGDGDRLYSGISSNDYAYFFKSRKIYAILGDLLDGQLLDIDLKNGCPYPYMICEFEGIIYFLNDFGIYRIKEQMVQDINLQRIQNYFDKLRDDSINFEYISKKGFVDIDVDNREIMWFVPQKTIDNLKEPKNNLVIIYNVDFNYFKTRSYAHNIVNCKMINDLSGQYKRVMADEEGNFFEWSKVKNDANNEIEWSIRTKKINMDINSFNKLFKIIKVAGRCLDSLRITYWIDGERHRGNIIYRPSKTGIGNGLVKIWNKYPSDSISIELTGRSLGESGVELEEILLGYNLIKSVR